MPSNLFESTLEEIVSNAEVINNPIFGKLKELAKKDEKITEYGSMSYVSKIRCRSAKFTEILYTGPNEEQKNLLEKVKEYLEGKKLIEVDRILGADVNTSLPVRLYITNDFARQALMWRKMLFLPREKIDKPKLRMLFVPEWPERRILVDPKSSITIALGSDYSGEVKKAGLRMAMYHVKKQGGLGLHAGSKCIYLKDPEGKPLKKGVLLFGLSGTGKTTLTCHHHWVDRTKDERVVILQDDVVFLWPDGSCSGSEDNFYIKTEGMEEESQPLLYKGLTRDDAILENVHVAKNGKVDFFNYDLTSNGRAVVLRQKLEQTVNSIDLNKINMILFITRRKTVVPPIVKLTSEQAGAFFMLGESIETSAGDPAHAGESVRVVGTNPFIIGSEDEEGNIFFNFVKKNNIQCYLLNTGRFGFKDKENQGEKITIKHSSKCIVEAARDNIQWKKDSFWGYLVPKEIPGLDLSIFDWTKYYSKEDHLKLNKDLKKERLEWLNKFPNLKKEIKEAIG